MSGHSKWATIKRQKGVADVKRGQIFTKLARAIIIAVREGGSGDPEQNFRLRLLIEKARAVNMPKDNIERAIEKGKGRSGSGDELFETVYEGFGPGGISVIVEAATDNKLRTTGEVKSIFDKNGGTMGVPGAVAYLFQKKGQMIVKKNGQSSNDIFLSAADAGAEDIEELQDEVIIYTLPEQFALVKNALTKAGIEVVEADIIRQPITTTQITDKQLSEKVLSFVEKLETHDDVQKVYANFDILEVHVQ